jgi:ComF family protein
MASGLTAQWPIRTARAFSEGLLRILYPPRCIGCGGLTTDPVCARCLIALERADPADLGAELARLPTASGALDSAFALWVFDKGGVLQRTQHALKYGNRPRYGLFLGGLIGTALLDSPDCLSHDLLVPVPLYRTRLYERGYNQSLMLARGIHSATGAPVCEHALVRNRSTRSQTRLSQSARWANVSDAFSVRDPGAIAGRQVLLVDDVFTTGSTAASAAVACKAAGAIWTGIATLALAR